MRYWNLTNPFVTFTTLFFSIILHFSAKSQKSTSDLYSSDTTDYSIANNKDESEEISYFIFDVSYTNNNQLNQKSDSLKVSSFFADFSFYHSSGLYFSILPSNYLQATTSTYDFDAALGFQKSFDVGIDLSAQYLHHYFKGDTMLRGINYEHSVDISVSFSYMGLFSGLDANSLFGISNNYYLTPSLGYYIDFENVLFNDDYFTFFPNISATFSTDYWLYDNLGTLGDKYLQRYIEEYLGYPTKTMSLQSFDFMVPISYSIGSFTLSGSYMYTIPSDKYKSLKWEEQSSLLFSISYLLNL